MSNDYANDGAAPFIGSKTFEGVVVPGYIMQAAITMFLAEIVSSGDAPQERLGIHLTRYGCPEYKANRVASRLLQRLRRNGTISYRASDKTWIKPADEQ